ncbi:MAG: DUF1761 domain-containing protein [Candidatus Andersenbacteria bacterium]|nr:DUF1761 domain-containing protein [Candidatus Andersenbacteria bacterium]MBI3250499.1 DUF1761 domain-containing protein [Candidatus Andersenbacteria bacterium]
MPMEVPVNYLAVITSAVVNMVIGTLWYGPLFGKKWIALMKFTPEQMAEGKAKGMGKLYAMAALTSFLMAYVLSHSLTFASAYTETTGVTAGLMVGFWSWLGFAVPITISSVLWEGKSWTLWILNIGYYLVTLLAVGVILAVWQ